MKKERIFKNALWATILLFAVTCGISCSDDNDEFAGNGNEGVVETNVGDIRKMIVKTTPGSEATNLPDEIQTMTLQGIVISDKLGGNSSSFLLALTDDTQEGNSGLTLAINESDNSFKEGDVVKVSLRDAKAQLYNNQLQVSTTNKPEVVQKITPLKPIVITIDRLSDYDSQYVMIEKTQPVEGESGTWYNDNNHGNVAMQTLNGKQYKVYTMSQAIFAGEQIPAHKSGSIAGIVGVYKGTWQIKPRNLEDIQLTEERFEIQTESATLAEVLEAEVGTYYEVKDVVIVGVNEQGVMLKQGDAYMYAYKGGAHGMKLGDVVTISGKTELRNQLKQFGKGCTMEKTDETEVSYPTPTKMTGADLETYAANPVVKYVSYEGSVLVSGNYTNVEIEGCSYQGSLDYMSDDFKEKYNNHKVTITGWLFGSYKNFIYTLPVETVDQGDVIEQVPEGAIFYSTFDKELSSQSFGNGGQWPFLNEFDGWQNHKGTGAGHITYDYANMSVRTNQSSKGSLSLYDGSGKNNIFFSTAPNHFTIQKIAVSTRTLKLSFGAQRYGQGAVNTFIKSDFEVRLSADGELWSQPLKYDFEKADEPGQWRLATANFTLPAGVTELYIKFVAKYSSANRLDDVLLTAGEGGQEIEFGKEEEVPLSSISTVINSPVDQIYKIQGQIIGTHTKGFLVKDETGIILVFKKKHGMKMGAYVTVEGATTEYSSMKQFGETSIVTLVKEGTYTQPKPEILTGAGFEAYAKNPSIKYIEYVGELTSYQDDIWQWHYNVKVGGTDIIGVPLYPDSNLNFKDLVDKKVRIRGYALGMTGNNLNTMVIDAQVER